MDTGQLSRDTSKDQTSENNRRYINDILEAIKEEKFSSKTSIL